MTRWNGMWYFRKNSRTWRSNSTGRVVKDVNGKPSGAQSEAEFNRMHTYGYDKDNKKEKHYTLKFKRG